MRPIARHATAALILAGIALATWPATPRTLSPGCLDWIEVRRADTITLHCGLEALSEALARCPPTGVIRRGDRVTLERGCVRRVAPMPAARRLALGIRLDVNAATASELQRISGIGPAMSRRIRAKRPYARLEDLERVRGIGRKRRLRFTSSLRLGPPASLWPSSPRPAASAPRTP